MGSKGKSVFTLILALVAFFLIMYVLGLTYSQLSPQAFIMAAIEYAMTPNGSIIVISAGILIIVGIVAFKIYKKKSAWGIKKSAVKELKKRVSFRIKDEL